jgi:hypothetical protein
MSLTSEYIIEQVSYNQLISQNKTMEEMFSDLKLSETIPFASFKKYSKILKNFTPESSDWLNASSRIKLYVELNTEEGIVHNEAYITISDKINNQNKNPNSMRQLYLQFQFRSKKEDITNIENSLKYSFNLRDDFVFQRLQPVGVFNLIDQNMNVPLLLDMIMNEDDLSLFSVDESKQTTKTQTVIIFDNKNKTDVGKITFYLTEQIDELTGKVIVRVKVSTIQQQNVTLDKIKVFQKELSSMFKFYKDILESYIKIYEKVGIKIKITTSKKKKIKDATSKFKSSCAVSPEAFENKEDALEYAGGEEERVFKFPKDGDLQRLAIYDQLWYACNTSNKPLDKWPGLTKKMTPCCYKKNQLKKESATMYYKYMNPGTESTETVQQGAKQPGKILNSGQYGILPEYLNNVFGTFVNKRNEMFRRFAVTDQDDKFSFLKCVFNSIVQTGNNDFIVYPEISDLADKWYTSKQEMYDKNQYEITSNIEDDDYYFDPRLYISMLENYFDCKIYVFDKSGIVIPRFRNGYYKKQRKDKPVVFIYENENKTGTKLCEQIVFLSGISNLGSIYDKDLIDFVEDLFYASTSSSTLTFKIPKFVDLNLTSSWTIQKQGFDSYGKTRYLLISKNENLLLIFTSPLQPYNIPVIDKKEINQYTNDSNSIKQFLGDLNYNISNLQVIPGDKTEYVITIDNVEIRFNSNTNLLGVNTITKNPSTIHNTESEYSKFIHNKKIAHYIQQYMFWLFSKEEQSIESFFTNKTILIVDHKYNTIPSINFTFDDSNGILKDQKLIITSQEMKAKLTFILKLNLIRNPKLVEWYKQETKINNYFIFADDFKVTTNTNITYGESGLQLYVNNFGKTITASNSILHDQNNEYFFINKLIRNSLFLAINTDSLKNATSRCNSWVSQNSLGVENIGVYIYNNEQNINLLNNISSNVNIVVSRKENTEVYTCLLKL